MSKCSWPLGNGQTLDFTIYSVNDQWKQVAGLYIFAYPSDESHWGALYVGKTDDFSSRVPGHEKWDSAVRLGATNVHALVVPQRDLRDTWERCLIAHLQPTLNEVYKEMTYLSSLLSRP